MVRRDRTSRYRISHLVCAVLLLSGLMSCDLPRTLAQEASDYGSERQLAFKLLDEGRFGVAQDMFEKLAVANPSDGAVQYGVGMAVLANSTNIKDTGEQRQARIRARNSFLRAKELGYKNDLMEASLARLAPDGGEVVRYSRNAEADQAMHEGEAAVARNDYDGALASFERALKIDPQLYFAAVFTGDVYARKQETEKAVEWYSKAIALAPNHGAAYRYWSALLLKNNKMEEAKAKAIEAIIAEPYDSLSYQALTEWAKANQAQVGHPQIKQPDPPIRPADANGEKSVQVAPKAITPKQGAPYYWSFYNRARAAYPANFAKDHPTEKAFRHSLKEEAAALSAVAEAVASDLKAGKIKKVDDQSLAALLKLYQANLIEPYVLLARADKGISQDYEAYRQTNRDDLRRYLAEMTAVK